ncbi:MAG: hypothetical protein QM708_14115 [Propioniciclava sp.]|uniref:hypothetical protein n=1 Tax=Propioniciclava sp. TaxID=2038686 RepID=UPI0039E499A1
MDDDGRTITLQVDTGTNPLARALLGLEVRDLDGIAVVDQPYWVGPWVRNERAGRHLDTTMRLAFDRGAVRERGTLVQVQTAKDESGRSRAFSRAERLGAGGGSPVLGRAPSEDRAMTASSSPARTMPEPLRTGVAHRTAAGAFSRAASLDDLLGSLVRAAAPLLRDLLGGTGAASLVTPEVLGELLRTVLGATGTVPAPAAASAPTIIAPTITAPATPTTGATTPQPPAAQAPAATAETASVVAQAPAEYLFSTPASVRPQWRSSAIAQAQAWPAATPPSVLPLLLNALAMRHASCREAATPLASALDPRTRMRLLQLLRSAGEDDAWAEVIGILQARPVSAPEGTPVWFAQSASTSPAPQDAGRASRALLTPVQAPALDRPGGARVVYAPTQTVSLRFRLDVPADGPATPLPRAILELSVREPGTSTVLLSRTERLTEIAPGGVFAVTLSGHDIAALPQEVDLDVVAELRWPTSSGVHRSVCASRVVVAAPCTVRTVGDRVGAPIELTDMPRYRTFWNRVWTTQDGDDAALWGFDSAVRYSVLLTAGETNGLMQTRTAPGTPAGGVRKVTSGRVKAGIEVAVPELNALLALWPGHGPLDAVDVTAFRSPAWLSTQGGDATVNVRFEGRRRTRGALWAVPVIELRTFTVGAPAEVDAHGQVLSMADRQVAFPVVQAIRLLGLTSTDEQPDPTPEGYLFDGYQVVFDVKAGLEPARSAD